MAKNEIHFRNTYDCIKKIKSIRTMYRDTTPSYVALSDAIQSIEEIQQYRAIGTVEELKKIEESFNVISDKVWNYILAGEELLERYEAIGTIEEFKALKEKSVAKEPDYEGDGCWDGHVVIDTWICPNCEKHYEVDYDDYDYCPNCGQHIDHSGLTEDD